MPQLQTCGTQDPRPIQRPFFGGTHQNRPSTYSKTSFWWHLPKQTLNLFKDLFLVAPTKTNPQPIRRPFLMSTTKTGLETIFWWHPPKQAVIHHTRCKFFAEYSN